jgi:hypothetical protein
MRQTALSSDTLDQTMLRAANLPQELHDIEPARMQDWVHGMEAENKAQATANLIADTIIGLMMQKAGADG